MGVVILSSAQWVKEMDLGEILYANEIFSLGAQDFQMIGGEVPEKTKVHYESQIILQLQLQKSLQIYFGDYAVQCYKHSNQWINFPYFFCHKLYVYFWFNLGFTEYKELLQRKTNKRKNL